MDNNEVNNQRNPSVTLDPIRDFSRERERWVIGAILLLGFFLRTIDLGLKPEHFDEGINGNFVSQMWSTGFYKYDPNNFHGPLYFYFLQASELIFGWGLKGYRFVTGLMSVGVIALIAAHRRFVGRSALWAAALVSVSPAFVFYSRYAIHESLFVLGQVGFCFGYLLWSRERSSRALAFMAAASVVLMATKETFFIFFGTFAIAVAIVDVIEKYWPAIEARHSLERFARKVERNEVIVIAFISIFILFALFTGFFMNPMGAGDFFKALAIWSKTGSGSSGHEKPLFYYVSLMQNYEWPVLVSLCAAPLVFFQVSKASRIIVLFAVGAFLSYSLVPYKTPWLILNMLWPLAFVFGHLARGTMKMFASFPPLKLFKNIFILTAFWTTTQQMHALNFHNYADPSEPYVYVQSTIEFKRAVDLIERLTIDHPDERNMVVVVINREPWPLPHLMLPYPNYRFGDVGNVSFDGADVVLSDAVDRAAIESKLKGEYWILPFQIRDAYNSGWAYFTRAKFAPYLPADTNLVKGGSQ